MAGEDREIRAALEQAQAELKQARTEVEVLRGEAEARRLAEAQLSAAQDELAVIRLREKELVDALMRAKSTPLGGPNLDDETQRHLTALKESERGSSGLTTLRKGIYFAPFLVGSALAWTASGPDMDKGLVFGILAVVALIGVVGATIGFGDRT